MENSRADVIVKIVNCLPYVIEKTLRYFITVRSKAVNSYIRHILCIERFNHNVERYLKHKSLNALTFFLFFSVEI